MATVLLVEDQDEVREVLRIVLEHAGYQVHEAPDGQVALESYRENPADVVVTNMLMPRKSGLELIIDLQREFPAVKIIAMSSAEDMLTEARRLGAETLLKPFLPKKDLLRILRRMLSILAGVSLSL